MTSPELTGGHGFSYEDAVVARYLAALVCGTTEAGLGSRVVHRVAQQQQSFGEPLDDVIVDAVNLADGTVMRLSLQVKRELTISDAASNDDFRDTVRNCWLTLQKADFRENVDRVGAVVGTISDAAFRDFTTVCEWARASQATKAFFDRFGDTGNGSANHKTMVNAVQAILRNSAGDDPSAQDVHRLFAHLLLIKFDALHEGSSGEADVLARMQRALVANQVGRAGDAWFQLRQCARDGAGRSAEHTRASVIRTLPSFRFVGTPALAGDLQLLRELTRAWLIQQADVIGGTRLVRTELRAKLGQQMAAHRMTLVKGLPGTGKSVLLKELISQHADNGPTLLLAANRLSGRSWAEHARLVGLSNVTVEPLLVELASTGNAVLFIDGVDRIAPEQRDIVLDVLGQILSNPDLSGWRVIATARDAGIEPLRNWMPPVLLGGTGVGYVEVRNLGDSEAAVLAAEIPALRPLLLGGDERVRSLARRPFFASVLARGFSTAGYPTDFAPRAEVDLINAWWSRGGYDAAAPQTLARQRALVELAQRSAPDLGRNLRIRELDAPTQEVFPALEEDGLVQQVRIGHTAQFSHDIFFEWSFYHLLQDRDEGWIEVLTQAGEPPALGRVVELLSQALYADPQHWVSELQRLMATQVRPQWLRAWLIGPVCSAEFSKHSQSYADKLFADDHRLLGKLLVWMQAEKTTPNPLVLSGQLGTDLDAPARLRLADACGWPSDISAWRRLLLWAIGQIDAIPDRLLPDLVTLFGTWQMAYADIANPVSEGIVGLCANWLDAIEEENARDWRERRAADVEDAQTQRRTPSDLESELRNLVLRAARSYPDTVSTYLDKVASIHRWGESKFTEVASFAPLLAQTHPAKLAHLCRQTLLEELPDDQALRRRREAEAAGRRRIEIMAMPPEQRSRFDNFALGPLLPDTFQHHDWQHLSIDGDHQGYFPASPLREPFHSLLAYSATIGIALVRDFANHATTAWRQLHQHMPENGTPVALRLAFPWGEQEFWGGPHQYKWFRGHGGPQALECALMAIERWALNQLNAGESVTEVIRRVLEGHSSVAMVGIAVHLALKANEVSAVTLPLVSSQRLWHLDLERCIKESEFRAASLIGFNTGQEDTHRRAIADGSDLASRRLELRNLVLGFVLSDDTQLKDACCRAIERFPEALEFTYEEEAQDVQRVSELRRTAELWSEWGHAENYAAVRIPGRDDVIGIELRSPRRSDADVQQVRQRHDQLTREMNLWSWVEKCFETKQWAQGFLTADAVTSAKQMGAPGLLSPAVQPALGQTLVDGAIAGTAAALICFTVPDEHQTWANGVIAAYQDEPEPPCDDLYSRSVIPWHPKIFVARALAARICQGRDEPTDRLNLYRLAAHSLEVVSLAAIAGIVSCWDCDPRYAGAGSTWG